MVALMAISITIIFPMIVLWAARFESVGTCYVLPEHVWHSILDLRFFLCVVLLVEIHQHAHLITLILFACFHFILYYSSFNIGNYFYNILPACALCVCSWLRARAWFFVCVIVVIIIVAIEKANTNKNVLNHPRTRYTAGELNRCNKIYFTQSMCHVLDRNDHPIYTKYISSVIFFVYLSLCFLFEFFFCCCCCFCCPGLWQQHKENEMRHHCHVTAL